MPRIVLTLTALLGAAVLAYALGFWLVQWAGRRFATIVRCQVLCAKGHVFEAAWVVAARIPGVRVLHRRIMFCPVGRHRTWCAPIEPGVRARLGIPEGGLDIPPETPTSPPESPPL